jgi:glycosyltransferase involved in cell wall biosynthesis
MKKYQVILFQTYLRRFVLNFGKYLKNFEFKSVSPPPITGVSSYRLPNFEQEIRRSKNNWKTMLRRFFGVPNVRIRVDREGDLFFTYGSLVISPKPYCTYLETGLALYNYDAGIAKNPIARFVVGFLASRSNCKRLIFLSEAARKSFFSTVRYPEPIRRKLYEKSIVIYPIPIEKRDVAPKKFRGRLKLLFPGIFYMKGGLEVAHAYERLRKRYSNVSLTIVTTLRTIKESDLRYLRTLPGLKLLDAKLSAQEMIRLYETHDLFLLPTFREGFGLVVIEALAYGLPVIVTDQYAVAEMAIDGENGFVYPDHPLKDYDPKTYRLLGKYHNPKEFYAVLFRAQKEGELKPVEDFLVSSITKFIANPNLLEKFSKNSLSLYRKKFDAHMLARKLESVFLDAVKNG